MKKAIKDPNIANAFKEFVKINSMRNNKLNTKFLLI